MSRPTGTRRWVVAGTALAAGMTLVGCGASAQTIASSSTPTSFAADSWVDAADRAKDATSVTADRHVVATEHAGERHVVIDVDRSGRLLASLNSDAPSPGVLGTPHLGWLDESGFAPLRYEDTNSKGHQITAADHDGENIVWVETTSTNPFLFDWTVWSTSETGRHQVDASQRLGPAAKQHRVFGMTEPVLSGQHVAWAADVASTEVQGASVLVDTVADRAKTPEETTGAMLPALVGDTLYAARSPHFGNKEDDRTRIVARDLATGEERDLASATLDDSHFLTRLVASTEHVAWVVSDPRRASSELFVLSLRTGETRGVRLEHPGLQTMALSISEGLLAWGNGSTEGDAGQYVMSLQDGSIWRLGEEPGYSRALVDGDTVAWADSTSDSPDAPINFVVARWTGED